MVAGVVAAVRPARPASGPRDVYVDFTSPASTRAAAEVARAPRTPAVIGTTGLSAEDEAAVAALAAVAPIVVAANFSLGVNLLLGLVEQAARALGPEWDAEVVETHHHKKRDAPSGTALMIAQRDRRRSRLRLRRRQAPHPRR